MHAASPGRVSPAAGRRLPLWRRLGRLLRPGPRMIDVESLPDYLQRDLGFTPRRPAPRRDPLRD